MKGTTLISRKIIRLTDTSLLLEVTTPYAISLVKTIANHGLKVSKLNEELRVLGATDSLLLVSGSGTPT